MSSTEEIIALEKQTWEALKTSGQSLLSFISQDCVMMFPGGAIFDTASSPTLAEILSRQDMKPWTSYHMDEIRVLALGADAAAICYQVEAQREEEVYDALVTSVWRKKGAQWQLCVHQQSPALPMTPA